MHGELDADLLKLIKQQLAECPEDVGAPQARYLVQRVEELEAALHLAELLLNKRTRERDQAHQEVKRYGSEVIR